VGEGKVVGGAGSGSIYSQDADGDQRPSPATTDLLQDWERARYKRFVQLQWDHKFDEAIELLNEEYPPLESRFSCDACGRFFASQVRADDHSCLPPERSTGRPRQALCSRGHDLSVTRRLRPDGTSAGCARCHEDKKHERELQMRATG
jgi:hypothetical protein